MTRHRESRPIKIRRIHSQEEKRTRYQPSNFPESCPETAEVCGELADELELTGFGGSFTARCAGALPWLFLLSVVERRPKS